MYCNNKGKNMSALKHSVDNISAVVGTLTFNGYTIATFLKEQAFPAMLAIGSLFLTIAMICVQIRKNKLLKMEMKMQEELYKKVHLEQDILQVQLHNNNKKDDIQVDVSK
jgi:hypothetical protein